MKNLIKPNHLQSGDTVAFVSPSSGLAGEEFVSHRVELAKQRMENIFGLKVKLMKHALDGTDTLYNHPEYRAEDIHDALLDDKIKGIFSFIGGEESMRIVPYLNENIIREHPKIFMGYSDVTSIHLKFYKAGVMSYYGPALLTDFAENVEMDEYTIKNIKKVLFTNNTIGNIPTSNYYRKFGLKWNESNKSVSREKINNQTYEVLSGKGKATGTLIGGCFEVLNNLRGTEVFPNKDAFKGKILFVENSESQLPIYFLKQALRSLGYMGILKNIEGIIVGKPQNDENIKEIKETWMQVLKEHHLEDKILFFNASFGHNEPKCILPYGVVATLDAEQLIFEVNESGCS
ncbi:LD-carboxypeptidase family protein [Staphylococcus piscifermentans]|uniref:LD-carboxypeptidase n=1 Tax=Staphylococcus piscifermentans TaxID=70258 RepID=A0A239UGD7_9STAP|nr:S66 peptidase family protein [Staphylococcus piscifermentans]RTX81873.1 LD-carboxypeptidase [Staphylococcus piscifermentans]GEP85006.1 LD-carboxypeptidase [Staphylococcus piscifermentans]SNV08962.1 LD-carboxypeptidase family protein [Staphylococcus piscifermentans]